MKIGIVGLGIAGLSIAARLAREGHDVEGFDQYAPLHALGSSHGDTRIIRLTPGEGEIYVRLADESAHGWRAWQSRAGETLVDWMDGCMAGPAGSAFIASCIALSQAHGRSARVINAREALLEFEGRVRLPDEWIVCVQEDCGVLRADAARAFLEKDSSDNGAQLYWSTRIEAPIEGPRLRVAGETRVYDRVIVAAGAWAARMARELAGEVVVKRRVVGWFDGPADVPVICAAHAGGFFGMPTPGGRYKIGLHNVGPTIDDPANVAEPNAADAALLAEEIRTLLPHHNPAPQAMTRCLYAVTADENFIVRASARDARVLLFSCCSGHGFKYGPAFGQMAADWIADRHSAALAAFGTASRAPAAAGLGER